MSNIQHSSATNEWYTPKQYTECAHEVLGGIDFDPFSCAYANENHVKAVNYLESGGFDISNWIGGNLWINPPGGKEKNKSRANLAWNCLMQYRELGKLNHAIFLGFSLEQLSITQKPDQLSMCDFTLVIPDHRIRFCNQGGSISPTHASVIVYVPGNTDATMKFWEVFSKFGAVMFPNYPE